MSRSLRASAHTGRDAALRRLRILNRVLVGGALAATGLLTDVTAHAFTGHKRQLSASAPSRTPAPPDASRGGAHPAHHHGGRHARRHRRAALRPPARAPAPATSTTTPGTTTATAPQPAPVPAPQPAPVPAPPAPTVSGGS
ncbi:MAG TPA: hypothetical protein VHV28_10060 [Solirubrobacteraceae bacterium]|jgi:hypothetical protein|nr:hypothetical protein [Solirubrobacteraceae bacterium]